MAKNKPKVGRPQKLSDDTKTITVRVPEPIYIELKKRAGRHMAETGESCSVSDLVRAAIERELKRK